MNLPAFSIRFLTPCWMLGLLPSPILAGEVYYSGFETFSVGNNTITGTENWSGSYTTSQLHGVMSEAQHGVVGIGNAAFIGGYATTVTKTSSGNSVFVRRPVNLDPVALGQEIVTFRLSLGIKDSSSTKRDNFEVLIYNQANALLGGLQFDNTTLDSSGKPRRLIYRLHYDTSTSAFRYTLTTLTFLPETMERLEYRINFRTNRWSASLSDVPAFQDATFYSGSSTRNLGSILVKMAVTNTTSTTILPGDNYLLFDDYTVRTDAIDPVTAVCSVSSSPILTWNEEAGYSYHLETSANLTSWLQTLPNASWSASNTADRSYTDPTTPRPERRFYRVVRSYP